MAEKPPDRSVDPGRDREAPRYPHVHVTLRSSNPYAVVSAVRLAMRKSKISPAEVARFSDEAFETEEPGQMRAVCESWATIRVES